MTRRSKWAEHEIGCGSDAGYQRHRRIGEAPCQACRTAHAQWMARWRADRRDNSR